MRSYDGIDLSPPKKQPAPKVPAERGMVLEEVLTGFVGAVVESDKENVSLEDRHGKVRVFPLGVFLLDGKPANVVKAEVAQARSKLVTASGSIAVPGLKARVAVGSRIWVEGKHDAELVEKVWGHDLRVEGVVVEPLDGIDDLAGEVRAFGPTRTARLGVLVDHLVAGSKESGIVAEVTHPQVLVTGHPYVDVWQAVKPAALKLAAWPVIPRGTPWKEGICAALGWGETWEGWQRVLGAVRTYADLEVPMLQSVERLIDFVTEP
jgi:hypothetical protein